MGDCVTSCGLADDGRAETLKALGRSRATPQQPVLREKVLLMAADGVADTRIAEEVGVTPVTVRA